MKKDISNKTDIILLIDSFYEKVKSDPLLEEYFNNLVQVNWEKHLPIMYAFWQNVLFHTDAYAGNPMHVHSRLHEKFPVRMEHFQHWLQHFNKSVDERFTGANAELIKQRAASIATVMQLKIMY